MTPRSTADYRSERPSALGAATAHAEALACSPAYASVDDECDLSTATTRTLHSG